MRNLSLFNKCSFIYILPLLLFFNTNTFAEGNKEKKKLYLSGYIHNITVDTKYLLSVKNEYGKEVGKQTLLKDGHRFFIRLDSNSIGQTLTVKTCTLQKTDCLEKNVYINPDFIINNHGYYTVNMNDINNETFSPTKNLRADDKKSGAGPLFSYTNVAFGLYNSFCNVASILPSELCRNNGGVDLSEILDRLHRIEAELLSVNANVRYIQEQIQGLQNIIVTQSGNQAYNFINGVYQNYVNAVSLGDDNLVRELLYHHFSSTIGETDLISRLVGLYDIYQSSNSITYPNAAGLTPYFDTAGNRYFSELNLKFRYNGSPDNPEYHLVTPDLGFIQAALFNRIIEGLSQWGDLTIAAIQLYKGLPEDIKENDPEQYNRARLTAMNALSLERIDTACLNEDQEGEACFEKLEMRYQERVNFIKSVFLNYAGLPGHFTVRNSTDKQITFIMPYIASKLYTKEDFYYTNNATQIGTTHWYDVGALDNAFSNEDFDFNFTTVVNNLKTYMLPIVTHYKAAAADHFKQLYRATISTNTDNNLSDLLIAGGGFFYAGTAGKQIIKNGWTWDDPSMWTKAPNAPSRGIEEGDKTILGFWTQGEPLYETEYDPNMRDISWSGDRFNDVDLYNKLWKWHRWSREGSGTKSRIYLRAIELGNEIFPAGLGLSAFISRSGCVFDFGSYGAQRNTHNSCMQNVMLPAFLVFDDISGEDFNEILFQPETDKPEGNNFLYCPKVKDIRLSYTNYRESFSQDIVPIGSAVNSEGFAIKALQPGEGLVYGHQSPIVGDAVFTAKEVFAKIPNYPLHDQNQLECWYTGSVEYQGQAYGAHFSLLNSIDRNKASDLIKTNGWRRDGSIGYLCSPREICAIDRT